LTSASRRGLSPIDTVRTLHDIWNTGDVSAIDAVYAESFVAHWPPSSEIPTRHGLDGIRLGVTRIRTAFPDWHEEVIDVFASGDRVASRYISRGTHRGMYWGIEPTGLRIEVEEIAIFRCVADGRVEE
jgi:ketosteroid isomerase-like protein